MRATEHGVLSWILFVSLNGFFGAALNAAAQTTAPNEWTWAGGSNAGGEPQVTGTLGVPAVGNIPAARYQSVTWSDKNGNFWLFGGTSCTSCQGGYDLELNDLWELNPSTTEWSWMGGSSTGGQSGVYGTKGTPAAQNVPGGREGAAGWTDSSGNLWLFGGYGPDAKGNFAVLNDLWEFSPSTGEWTWMSGSSSVTDCFNDGSENTIGEIHCAKAATFGGEIFPIITEYIFQNDLWEYQPSAGPVPTTATPTFSVQAGSYSSPQSVTISDATNGAFIYYTTDGTTPTVNSTVFIPSISRPIDVQFTETLKAIAVAVGCDTSAVATAVYTLPPQAATPTFSLPTGTYTSFQTVVISDVTPGANIFYTVDGSTPTTNSNVYKGPLSIVNLYTTLQAIAIASNHSISNVASATYTLNLAYAAAPTFSVAAGTYNTPQTVIISDATPGAIIYYQINTGYPTTSSPVYNGPITVSATESIWAMATATNYFPSGYTGVTYNINPLALQTATPTFSVPAGTYTAPQTVTISDATNGAFFYYTSDGSTPTTNSNFYPGPITVSSSETLQAIAVADGETISAVSSAAYVINLPNPTFSITGTAISVAPGATTRNTSTITLTPSNGFAGAVSLSCSITPTAPSDPATCSVPNSVTLSGSTAQSATLTVHTTAATSAQNRARLFFWPSASGVALACILLVGIPARRRWRNTFGILAVLFAVAGGALGCGGGGSSGGSGAGGGGGNLGTTPGSYTITVTGTSNGVTQEATVSLTVQ